MVNRVRMGLGFYDFYVGAFSILGSGRPGHAVVSGLWVDS
jgi:hypothetical protein